MKARHVEPCSNFLGRTGSSGFVAGHREPGRTLIRIDFLKPFAASNTVESTLQPVDAGTQVTWAMYGPSPFVSKLMGLVFNIDKMVGKDFEAGLANMQSAASRNS